MNFLKKLLFFNALLMISMAPAHGAGLSDVQLAVSQAGLDPQVLAGKAVISFLKDLYLKNDKAFPYSIGYAEENYKINTRPAAIQGTISASAMTSDPTTFLLDQVNAAIDLESRFRDLHSVDPTVHTYFQTLFIGLIHSCTSMRKVSIKDTEAYDQLLKTIGDFWMYPLGTSSGAYDSDLVGFTWDYLQTRLAGFPINMVQKAANDLVVTSWQSTGARHSALMTLAGSYALFGLRMSAPSTYDGLEGGGSSRLQLAYLAEETLADKGLSERDKIEIQGFIFREQNQSGLIDLARFSEQKGGWLLVHLQITQTIARMQGELSVNNSLMRFPNILWIGIQGTWTGLKLFVAVVLLPLPVELFLILASLIVLNRISPEVRGPTEKPSYGKRSRLSVFFSWPVRIIHFEVRWLKQECFVTFRSVRSAYFDENPDKK